jgi:hypothetical protein
VIQPAYFLTRFEIRQNAKWSETNATVCLMWVSGWGNSDVVAHSRWRNAIRSLVAFFNDSSTLPDKATLTGITVSQHMLIDRYFNPTLASEQHVPKELRNEGNATTIVGPDDSEPS